MYIHISMYIHICLQRDIYTYIHTHTHTHTHIYIYTHTHMGKADGEIDFRIGFR